MEKVIVYQDNGKIGAIKVNGNNKEHLFGSEFNDLLSALYNNSIGNYGISKDDLLLRYREYDVVLEDYEKLLNTPKMAKYKDKVISSVNRIDTKKALRDSPKTNHKSINGKALVAGGLIAATLFVSLYALRGGISHTNAIDEVKGDNEDYIEQTINSNEDPFTGVDDVAADNDDFVTFNR